MRVGIGYDVHKLKLDYPLIIGGVEIPYQLGLLGHSDADVLIHAIMDAIIGALGKGDIGKLFPDTDEKYKGISSMILLDKVGQLMEEEGYSIGNIDSIIIAQKPKMAPYIEKMKANISRSLKIANHYINIKATTEEGLGFTGRGEGIAAQAIVLINSKDDESIRSVI